LPAGAQASAPLRSKITVVLGANIYAIHPANAALVLAVIVYPILALDVTANIAGTLSTLVTDTMSLERSILFLPLHRRPFCDKRPLFVVRISEKRMADSTTKSSKRVLVLLSLAIPPILQDNLTAVFGSLLENRQKQESAGGC
jgi:hypothetical protein